MKETAHNKLEKIKESFRGVVGSPCTPNQLCSNAGPRGFTKGQNIPTTYNK